MKRIYDTVIPSIKAKISKRQSGNLVTLEGYLIAAESQKPIALLKQQKHQFNFKEKQISNEINILISRLLLAYNIVYAKPAYPSDDIRSVQEKGVFTSAFERIDDEDHSAFNFGWRKSTLNKYIAFLKTILIQMDKYGIEIAQENIDEILIYQQQKAFANMRSLKNKNTLRNNGILFRSINKCLTVIYNENDNFKPLYFNPNTTLSDKKNECYKSIRMSVRRKMIKRLLNMIENGLSIGVATMLLTGARTAEVAALKIGDIAYNERFAVYRIEYQLRANGNIDDELKSKSSYRIAIGPYLFVIFLNLRIEYLKKVGFSESDILSLPLVSSPNNPEKICNTSELSAFGKQILLECGLKDKEYAHMQYLSLVEPDYNTDGSKNYDITNYICRRDFASRAGNLCGFTNIEIDYLMGHINENSRKFDYLNKKVQRRIADKLERAVLHEKYTLHPLFKVIIPSFFGVIEQNGYSSYTIKAPEGAPVSIKISNLLSNEPGQAIYLKSNGKIIKSGKLLLGKSVIDSEYIFNPPIGEVYKDVS